jgi:DNA-3-methyladenine glycosylase
MLPTSFFDRDAAELTRALLGKVMRRRVEGTWLAVSIIETEAYYIDEKGSHASLGRTPSREAVFMPAGTIYMYHSRAGDSLNFSAHGAGNAVLIKSGYPYVDGQSPEASIEVMRRLNPAANGRPRPLDGLCNGQTLLCRSLDLRIAEWTAQSFDRERFYVDDVGYTPERIIQTTRLGIPEGRDGHLMYRFIDDAHTSHCTSNPLTRRGAVEGVDYAILEGLRA